MGHGIACQLGARLPNMRAHQQGTSLEVHRTSSPIMFVRSSYSGRNRQEFPFRKSDEIGKDRRLGSIIIVLFTPGQAQEVTIFRGLPRNPSKPGELHKYQIPAKKPVNQKPFAYRHSSSERHIQYPRFL